MEEDPEKYENRLRRYYEEALFHNKQQFVEKYTRSVYNKVLGELLMTHKPPLVTIKALETEILYYVTQLRIYAKTTPDAEPATIAGLGGMRYGLDDGSQEARRRIWTLYHPSDLVEEEETNDAMIMDIGAITVEEDWHEE